MQKPVVDALGAASLRHATPLARPIALASVARKRAPEAFARCMARKLRQAWIGG